MNCVHETRGYVLREKGIDRQHLLYTRKGHKLIKVKNLSKFRLTETEKEKVSRCDRKLQYKEQAYDQLV